MSVFRDKIGRFYDMLSCDWSAAFVIVENIITDKNVLY